MARPTHTVPLTTGSVALSLAKRGYHVIPLAPGQKAAVDRGWTKLRLSPEEVEERWDENPEMGVGLLLGTEVSPSCYVMAIDVDIEDETLIDRIRATLPHAAPAKKGAKGITIICQTDRALRKSLFKRQKEATAAVEILASGQQTVLPPSLHPKGMQYAWQNGALQDYDPQELPFLSLGALIEIKTAVAHPDAKMFLLNEMHPPMDDQPGNYHNSCVEAVSSMVAFGMDDDYVMQRVIRAMTLADLRYGHEGRDYDAERSKVREWIKSSKDKDFGKKKEKDDSVVPEQLFAIWMRDVRWGEQGLYHQGGQVLMAYQDGHYRAYSPSEFHSQLASCNNNDISRLGIKQWRLICDTTFPVVPEFKRPPHRRVCLLNGTYDLDTGEVGAWSKDDFLISQLPFDYDPDATCPSYERFLSETFAPMPGEDEDERTLAIACFEEFVAMTMFECHEYHRFLVLEGSTRSGKSVLTHVASLMHHPDAISSVMAHDFNDERYRAAMLGKLINITGETSTVSSVSDDYLKMIVAGERVSVRHLYRPVTTVALPTRLLIATNDPLKTKDTSNAVLERMLVLRCDNYVKPKDRDTKLPSKLSLERAGIFNRMAAAWLRLRDRGDFVLPPSSDKMREDFEESNNPILAWIKDNTHQGRMMDDPEYKLPKGVSDLTSIKMLFVDFSEWCAQMKYMPRSINTFTKELSKIRVDGFDFGNVMQRVGGSGYPLRCRRISLLQQSKY